MPAHDGPYGHGGIDHREWLDVAIAIDEVFLPEVEHRSRKVAFEQLQDCLEVRPHLDADAVRRRMTRFVNRSDVADGKGPRPSGYAILMLKAAMGAHAALTGDWSRVAPHERDAVWSAASLYAAFHHVEVHEPLVRVAWERVVDGPFEFAFPFVSGSTTKGILMSRGRSALVTLSPSDAPVACSLPVPGGRRAPLRVRAYDGGFLRPVLSPGDWTPVGPEAFVRAAGDGVAWHDNPFHPQSDRHQGALGPTDYGRPITGPLSDRDVSREQAVAASLSAEVGTLYVIDGVVHRRCGAPRAVLAGPVGNEVLTWRIDGPGAITGLSSMDTVVGGVVSGLGFPAQGPSPETSGRHVPVQEAARLVAYRGLMPRDGGEAAADLDVSTAFVDLDPAFLPPAPGAMLKAYVRTDRVRVPTPRHAATMALASRLADCPDADLLREFQGRVAPAVGPDGTVADGRDAMVVVAVAALEEHLCAVAHDPDLVDLSL